MAVILVAFILLFTGKWDQTFLTDGKDVHSQTLFTLIYLYLMHFIVSYNFKHTEFVYSLFFMVYFSIKAISPSQVYGMLGG